MASCSKKSANLLGKRNPEDDLETKLILKKHKEKSEDKDTTRGFADSRVELLDTKFDQANLISVKIVEGLDQTPHFVEEPAVTLFVANLSPQTEISDIIDFFKNVGKVVRVQLIVNHEGNHVGYGFVQFASSNEAKKVLQKNGEYLHDRKIFLDVANKGVANNGATYVPPKYCIDHKIWYEEDYLQRESLLIEEDELETKPKPNLKKPKMGGLCSKKITFSYDDDDYLQQESLPIEEDEAHSDFVEEVLFVANLSPQTEISHIIDFFKNVGEVVSVRLIVNHEGRHVGYGFVEFASANEAKKALEKKNREYLHDHKIFLDVAKTAPYPPRPKYNLAEKLCYEDYLRREGLLIEEDEAVEGLDETPNFVEALAVRKKTIFVANLPCETEISNIIHFFKDGGEVVHVRLIVNHTGKHVGCGFVEFASANEAKKALQKKNCKRNRKIFLDMAKTPPYPLRPKYNLAEKLWYEDYLRRESLLIEEDEAVEGLDETPYFIEAVVVRKKRTLFVANLPFETEISNIINFFKDVGEVVHVRLIVNHKGKHVGYGFVEFASANEAKMALEKKNGEYLHDRKIVLEKANKMAPPRKYHIDHKIWYQEDYLRGESLVIEEDDLETKPNLKKPKMEEFCGKKSILSYDE